MDFRGVVMLVCFFGRYVVAELGEVCLTPNAERATCKSVYDCGTLLNVVSTRDRVQLRFLRQSQCGFDNNTPLVCCGSQANYAETTSANPTKRNEEMRGNGNVVNERGRRLLPSREQCGFQEIDRIYGGTETALGEFPWMVLLQYVDRHGRKKFACGGSLISSRYVLTAAHCVSGDIKSVVGTLTHVRLGEHDSRQEVDCISAGVCNNPPVDVPVESAHPHEGYDGSDYQRYNDIALIRLREQVSFSNYIRPICLPEPGQPNSDVDVKMTVAGWGQTERMGRSPVKLKVQVPVARKDTCQNVFSKARIRLRSTQICAGGERGKDSCTGDSGGPLMRPEPDDVSQWYVEGLVSFGAQCGTEGWPAVYTNVNSYLDWIYNTVRE